MLIKDAKPKLAEAKELKVRIPAHQHLRLHAMRVMTGKQISQTMIEALDAYFAVSAPAEPTAQRPPGVVADPDDT